MPQLEAEAITLDTLRERLTPEVLDVMFANTNLLDDATGRAAYLRKVIRESDAANANFKHMVNTCTAAGIVIERRAAFRMGVVLGLLMAEDLEE